MVKAEFKGEGGGISQIKLNQVSNSSYFIGPINSLKEGIWGEGLLRGRKGEVTSNPGRFTPGIRWPRFY